MANGTSPPAVVVQQQPSATLTSIAGSVLDSLRTSPILVLIILLNAAFAWAASTYLLQIEHYRADDRKALADLLGKCITDTVPISYLNSQKRE